MGTKHSRELTVQQLIAKGACHEQVQLFRELFGTRVDVTVQAVQSVAGKFDWAWAARNLLSDAARVKYYEVRAEYNKGCAAAFATAYINDNN